MTKAYQMRILKLEIIFNYNKQKNYFNKQNDISNRKKSEYLYEKINYNYRFRMIIIYYNQIVVKNYSRFSIKENS